jgi:hypothetical protein
VNAIFIDGTRNVRGEQESSCVMFNILLLRSCPQMFLIVALSATKRGLDLFEKL